MQLSLSMPNSVRRKPHMYRPGLELGSAAGVLSVSHRTNCAVCGVATKSGGGSEHLCL
jgi:hypothetical protein